MKEGCNCEQCQMERHGGWVRFMPSHGCGNKRCPKALSHRYKCTNSNDQNQTPEIDKDEP